MPRGTPLPLSDKIKSEIDTLNALKSRAEKEGNTNAVKKIAAAIKALS